MSDSLLPTVSPPFDRSAEVRVNGHVTRYVRRGAGQPVVVLRGSDDDAGLWPGLVEAIAARCRVILPEGSGTGTGFVSWFRGFLDGIGLPPVTLVAVGDYCVPALELALLDTEGLTRIVLVPFGATGEAGLTGTLRAAAQAAGLPALVVRPEWPPTEALRLVERFILGESA
jgi:pimeloyl-ACP methyl ester carboxylesterase